MLYTLRILTATQKVTQMDVNGCRLLTGFCLQALEMSRFRTTTLANSITQNEQDWLLKLETHLCEYLQKCVSQNANDAITMYIDAIGSIGTGFYKAAGVSTYPLILFEMLCHLCMKDESLKASKGRELVRICSEVLLNVNSISMFDKVSLSNMGTFDLLLEGIDHMHAYHIHVRSYSINRLGYLIPMFQ